MNGRVNERKQRMKTEKTKKKWEIIYPLIISIATEQKYFSVCMRALHKEWIERNEINENNNNTARDE